MIALHLLGAVRLTDAGGRPLSALPAQPRRFALLAYLAAATPHGTRRRDHLLPLFWPELDQVRARAALRQALHVLRGELGRDVLVTRGDEEIGLDFAQLRCDVLDFERAIAAGEPEAALDHYRGPLLDGFFIAAAPEFERWLESERAHLQEAAAGAAGALIARSETAGDFAAAAGWARRAIRLAPLDEGLLRRLIGLLDRTGDRAGALAAYEEFARRLARDFDAQPAAETRDLLAAVRARESAVRAAPLPPAALVARVQAALADRYQVRREIARGGTGTVFLAVDLRHHRPVAIKVLRPDLAAVVTAERFLREIRTAAGLRHPRIVALLDSGEAGGLLYFIMPYIPGETLRQRLDRERQLPIAEATQIALEVLEALGYAHAQGLVHRDIKPENILLEDGHALVADFGLARAIETAGSDRLTETGIALGSPAYMSPEQGADGGRVDGRSDLYALGCVLYEMLAGTPPFTGPTAQAVLARHALDPAPPIRTVRDTVPPALERAVLTALAKVPADRPGTAAHFAAALEAAPQAAPRTTPRRRPAVRIGIGAAAVLATALIVMAALHAGRRGGRGNPLPPAGRIGSLAVLPLQTLSRDSTDVAMADGMTMALNTALGRAASLQVTAPLAADHFRNSRLPERAIAESLGVDAVIEGSLDRSGDSLRLDLHLIDAHAGRQLWSGHFEDLRQHRFALEDAMSRGVATALGRPASALGRTGRTPPSANLEAYNLYLLGKIRVQYEDRANDSVAITLLQRAVALDPSFAAAFAELAHAYDLRATQFAPQDSAAQEGAEVAAAKALDLDPDLPEGHFARASILWGPGRRFAHELAIQEARRALSVNPNLAEAHHLLGKIYLHIGLLDSAIAEFQKTLALDPEQGFAQQRIGIALVYQGHYEDGLRTFQQVPPRFNPTLWHYQVAWALLYLGRDSEALGLIDQYLRQMPKDPGGVVTATRAILDAKRGDARRTEADIRKAIEKGKGFQHFHHTAYSIAMAYALLHRPQAAVRYLRLAADQGLPCYPCFRNDPYLRSLRGDPGFEAFIKDLEGQWRRYQALLRGPPIAKP
jgi:DNA-binding SARP family transcriptional activator/TolB-like protein/tetratricopeptide (TPR) repeat protein